MERKGERAFGTVCCNSWKVRDTLMLLKYITRGVLHTRLVLLF